MEIEIKEMPSILQSSANQRDFLKSWSDMIKNEMPDEYKKDITVLIVKKIVCINDNLPRPTKCRHKKKRLFVCPIVVEQKTFTNCYPTSIGETNTTDSISTISVNFAYEKEGECVEN
jgi:hypothetical protein